MGATCSWQFEARGVPKAGAAILLLEYWSSRAYQVHRQAFNELVLRVNGFGSFGKWLEDQAITEGQIVPYTSLPIQLTVRFLAKPESTHFTLHFELPDRWSKGDNSGFESSTREWVNEFIEYVNAWCASE
jgi:hypothetical protein